MKSRKKPKIIEGLELNVITLTLFVLFISSITNLAQAESLFRSGVSYQSSQPYTPRSLFAVPRPGNIGDILTIEIDELTQTSIQNNMTLSKEQTINENSVGIINTMIGRIFGIRRAFPSVDGLENKHEIGSTARSQNAYSFKDSITCQVVQILPNGNLVVQGRKTILASMEQQNLLVSGIVNPYYLDSQNSINSKQVANLQMSIGGKGPMTRQQGDGVVGKYFQFFN